VSEPRKSKIDTVRKWETLPAPGYSTRGGSGSSEASVFNATYDFREKSVRGGGVDERAVLTELTWTNGTGSPVLTIKGTAGPAMLKMLAVHLRIIAERMENHLEIIDQLHE